MSDASDDEQQLIQEYTRLLIENYCIVASSVLLWFDCAQTFPDECRRIWGRKFSGATVIYLSTRYLAVVERIFFVAAIMTWSSGDQVCSGLTHADSTLLFLSYLSIASFTALRVYAIWGRDWRPLVLVLPLSLVRPALTLYEASSYTAVQSGPRLGCSYDYTLPDTLLTNFSTAERASVIAADAVLIALTWRKTYGIKRVSMKTGVRTPLATLLLRDGTAYFLLLLSIQVVSITMYKAGNGLTFSGVWPFFDQTFSVIFLSRFMLDLRGLYFAEDDDAESATAQVAAARSTTISVSEREKTRRETRTDDSTRTLRWSDVLTLPRAGRVSSHVVGNLGATLDVWALRDTEEAPGWRDCGGGVDGGERGEEDGDGVWEWDVRADGDEDDSGPMFVVDPFQVGMGGPDVEARAGPAADCLPAACGVVSKI